MRKKKPEVARVDDGFENLAIPDGAGGDVLGNQVAVPRDGLPTGFRGKVSGMMLSPESLSALRQEYSLRGLSRAELEADPILQFQKWMTEAQQRGMIEPNAMTLSTLDSNGALWSRVVLLKACDARGFSFFTNYDGFKARHMAEHPRVALTFWWGALERQVNISGRVSQVPREESEQYFASRPLASRLGAWASQQSRVLENREELEGAFARVEKEFLGREVLCPPFWGGYIVEPLSIEFWQGRRSRLHDRFRFTREGATWHVERLSP